jgi:hypothetical protein
LPTPYLDAGACSEPAAHAPADTQRVGDGSPALRITGFVSRRRKDLPGYWTVLFVRAMAKHPAGYDLSLPLPLFERINAEAIIAFRENRTLGIRKVIV